VKEEQGRALFDCRTLVHFVAVSDEGMARPQMVASRRLLKDVKKGGTAARLLTENGIAMF
jgi:hypothetical protein